MKRGFVRYLFLLLYGGLFFCQGRVDGIVAVVGNNIILHSDILQQTQILAASRQIDPIKRPLLFERMYVETLEGLIDQYAVLDVAEKDSNLVVYDDEVDRALKQRIDEFIAQSGSKELFEEAVGMPLRQIKSDYWSEIRNMMFIERYKFLNIGSVEVSRPEVVDFFKVYKDSIPLMPENYTFSVIEVPFVSGDLSEKNIYHFLDSLRSLIVVGEASFDDLAAKHSQDIGSSVSGGNLGFTSRGTLVQSYEKAAYALVLGEISVPIRTQFGYHLIRLIDKRGEKISSQHILLRVPFSDDDKKISLTKAQHLYTLSYNDPFVFDSVSITYDNNYDNFSGIYSKLIHTEIPFIFLETLNTLSLYDMSSPIETGAGYALLYLSEHSSGYAPNLSNSWNLVYQYAKQEKQNRLFNDFVNKIKIETFIKTFY